MAPSSPSHSPRAAPRGKAGSAPAPAAGDDAVWDQFAELFEELASLADQAERVETFYARLLSGCVEGLAALGGVVWSRNSTGLFTPLASHGAPTAESSHEGGKQGDHERQGDHGREGEESLLRKAEQARTPQTELIGDRCVTVAPVLQNIEPTSHKDQQTNEQQVVALIMLSQRVGQAPEFYRSCERLLTGVADLAAVLHTRHDLRTTHSEVLWTRKLLDFSRRVAGAPTLEATAYRIANECRELVDCDRVCLLTFVGRRPRVRAISGAESFQRRSGSIRKLQRLARYAWSLEKPLAWPPACASTPGEELNEEITDAELDAYCDATHARSVTLVRIGALESPDDAENTKAKSKHSAPLGVLVAERFDGQRPALDSMRLAEAATACAPALKSALEWNTIPFASSLRKMASLLRPSMAWRVMAGLIVAAAAIAALMLVEVEHTVTLSGVLQPTEQRALFAPSDSIVDRVLVTSGQQVATGDLLLVLSSPQLLLDTQRLEGELNEVESQRQAIAAARSSGDARGAASLEALRLAAEERRLALRIEALTKEIGLLQSERDDLNMTSPIDGVVVTWRAAERLASRPVERGQKLLTVVAEGSPWRLELTAPDDRIGLIFEAQAESDKPLRVAYETLAGTGVRLWGQLGDIAPQAEQAEGNDPSPQATIRIEAVPDEPLQPVGEDVRPLPGETVRARVYCGQRSLAYVWLHDVWRFATTWWRL